MKNKKTLELVEICLTFGIEIKIVPEHKYTIVTFKAVSMTGDKLIQRVINGDVTDKDIDLVRDVISMITAGDSIIDIEKRINEFVPF